jgi:hypothetical protein
MKKGAHTKPTCLYESAQPSSYNQYLYESAGMTLAQPSSYNQYIYIYIYIYIYMNVHLFIKIYPYTLILTKCWDDLGKAFQLSSYSAIYVVNIYIVHKTCKCCCPFCEKRKANRLICEHIKTYYSFLKNCHVC